MHLHIDLVTGQAYTCCLCHSLAQSTTQQGNNHARYPVPKALKEKLKTVRG